jgi:hypothetical protein
MHDHYKVCIRGVEVTLDYVTYREAKRLYAIYSAKGHKGSEIKIRSLDYYTNNEHLGGANG